MRREFSLLRNGSLAPFIPRECSLGADQPTPSLGVSPEGTFTSVSTK